MGRSGVGKTTLLEGLVPELVRRGRRVATLKHTHHPWPDRPGSDSARLLQAGAGLSLLAGPEGGGLWGWEPPVEALVALAAAAGADCVMLEGYKHGPYPRLEVVRGAEPLLPAGDLWGLATDQPRPGIRCFGLRDYQELAAAIMCDEMFTTR